MIYIISTHSLTKRLTFGFWSCDVTALFQLTASRRGWRQVWCDSAGVYAISTHSLTKRLTKESGPTFVSGSFQLTASRRGWRRSSRRNNQHQHFNSQPHEEADYLELYASWSIYHFNSQPHEEADSFFWWSNWYDWHFNSQPHEEADLGFVSSVVLRDISTHSLTKRLTVQNDVFAVSWDISTHSLTKRLTNKKEELDKDIEISTHSLTKRLTKDIEFITRIQVFQLTASRRGWRTEGFWRTQELYFNSQPHEEADIWPTLSPIRPIEFQLTASRIGWRYRQWYFLRKLCISTHSLTKRLTTRKFSEGLTTRYFNSQPHEEADETCSTIQNYYRRFQLTASRRGWRISPPSSSPCDHISTHSLTKRLTTNTCLSTKDYNISTHSLTKRLTW